MRFTLNENMGRTQYWGDSLNQSILSSILLPPVVTIIESKTKQKNKIK